LKLGGNVSNENSSNSDFDYSLAITQVSVLSPLYNISAIEIPSSTPPNSATPLSDSMTSLHSSNVCSSPIVLSENDESRLLFNLSLKNKRRKVNKVNKKKSFEKEEFDESKTEKTNNKFFPLNNVNPLFNVIDDKNNLIVDSNSNSSDLETPNGIISPEVCTSDFVYANSSLQSYHSIVPFNKNVVDFFSSDISSLVGIPLNSGVSDFTTSLPPSFSTLNNIPDPLHSFPSFSLFYEEFLAITNIEKENKKAKSDSNIFFTPNSSVEERKKGQNSKQDLKKVKDEENEIKLFVEKRNERENNKINKKVWNTVYNIDNSLKPINLANTGEKSSPKISSDFLSSLILNWIPSKLNNLTSIHVVVYWTVFWKRKKDNKSNKNFKSGIEYGSFSGQVHIYNLSTSPAIFDPSLSNSSILSVLSPLTPFPPLTPSSTTQATSSGSDSSSVFSTGTASTSSLTVSAASVRLASASSIFGSVLSSVSTSNTSNQDVALLKDQPSSQSNKISQLKPQVSPKENIRILWSTSFFIPIFYFCLIFFFFLF
jgi:hypothetical protein